MISENAAKNKVCPLISNGENEFNCVTKDCMGWRWSFNEEGKGFCVLISSQISIRNKNKKPFEND